MKKLILLLGLFIVLGSYVPSKAEITWDKAKVSISESIEHSFAVDAVITLATKTYVNNNAEYVGKLPTIVKESVGIVDIVGMEARGSPDLVISFPYNTTTERDINQDYSPETRHIHRLSFSK